MKRKLLSCALCAMTMTAVMAQQKKYSVIGEMMDTGYTGKVYMADMFRNELIDSTDVQNGKFTFKGEVEKPSAVIVKHPKYGVMTLFILEPGTINIAQTAQDSKATGTPLNNELNEYANQMKGVDAMNQREQARTILENMFAAHTNDILGVFALSDLERYGLDADEMLQLLDKCGDVVKEHPAIVAKKAQWEALKKTSAGQMFTDFTVEYNGKKTSLSDYVGKGKYVLVDFWASWCGPCRREIPNIAELYAKYKDKGLEVLGVATWDKPENTLKAMEELKVTWPQILNAQRIGSDAYSISGIPQIILFAPDGKIVARNLRGEELKKTIEEVMNK